MGKSIRNMIDQLNAATYAYDMGKPIMTDEEWDTIYFKLKQLEERTGLIYPDSPTQSVNYQVVNELNKVEHDHKMLSLDKTKDIEELIKFLGNKPYIIMAKMDGLTCSLTYEDGYLVKAETRGNGVIGEDVLHNARVIGNIPTEIPYPDKLVVDGEIICKYDDFEDFSNEYKNPRNFAAGSIRLLDSKECSKRKLSFVAWDIIEGFSDLDILWGKLNALIFYGFTVVPFYQDETCSLADGIEYIRKVSASKKYPIDGIVVKFNNDSDRAAAGETAHHFKDAMAYKFYDEEYETELQDIIWSMGRTGVLTPVAVFTPVDIDGSTVSRANLHNFSVMREILGNPYYGQKISVYKANMIIPQISKAEQNYTEEKAIPLIYECPICKEKVSLVNSDSDTINVVCLNPDCDGKFINKLDHYCGKKGLDIRGLSKATLEKLITWGWLNSISDIYNLKNYASEWKQKPGFGKASVENILNAIESSKECDLSSWICAIGIPLIGRTVSKDLAKKFNTYEDFRQAIDEKFDFTTWNDYGYSKSDSLLNFDYSEFDKIYTLLTVKNEKSTNSNKLDGKKFVITGSLKHFKNRAELQGKIEELGGKVVSSVSKNTDYLINNDINSTSSKNTSAKKLGIPILTEENFLENFLDI